MAVIESTATALVRFTGLGIVCFNEAKGCGEIGIIRDDKHKLSIQIQQPRFRDDSDKDIIVYEDIAAFSDLQKENVEISIKTVGDSEVKGYKIYQADGDFNRIESDDKNDFRWFVDIGGLHKENISVSKSDNRYPVTKLSVGNGLYYVHKLDSDLYFEKVSKDSNGEEVKREIYGNVAETMGVKIESDEVVFTIKIDEKEETINLKRSNGLPYRIEFKNMNSDEDADVSDMPDYYKYFANSDESQFELEAVDENSEYAQAGGVQGRQFCHPIFADIHSIDEII